MLHLLYARFFTMVLQRHGPGRLPRAVRGPAEPGHRHQRGRQDVEVQGQRRAIGGATHGLRRGRGATDPGVRRPARGRHRLGRHVAGRVGAVPAARLAAERRRHLAGGHAGRGRRRRAAPDDGTDRRRRRRAGRGASASTCVVARVMELVNATRKAIDSGCGPADPAVREAAEAVAILLSLVAPYTAEEMWERLGHEPTVARAGWPAVDPALLVGRLGDRRRPGPGQGQGAPGGQPGHLAPPTWRRWPWPTRRVVRAIEGREVRGSSCASRRWSTSSSDGARNHPPKYQNG